MSESHLGIGLPWWNNGKQNVRAHESPGPEWERGMIKRVDS